MAISDQDDTVLLLYTIPPFLEVYNDLKSIQTDLLSKGCKVTSNLEISRKGILYTIYRREALTGGAFAIVMTVLVLVLTITGISPVIGLSVNAM